MANVAIDRPIRVAGKPATRTWRVSLGTCLTYTALIALTVAALLLRLHGLTKESLWLDEGYTLLFSHLAYPQLIFVGGAHEHPPLYYVIVHALYGVRDSYLVPRVVSAVAGALSVPALFALGHRLYGRLPGLVAALLLVVSPFHLWYSQDGRAYELAGLFVILSYLVLFAALEGPHPRPLSHAWERGDLDRDRADEDDHPRSQPHRTLPRRSPAVPPLPSEGEGPGVRAVRLARLAGTHAVLGTSPALWSGYVLVTLLCLYTEYTTIFVLLPQVLLLLHARRHGTGGALIRAWLAISVLFAPWVGTLALDTAGIAGRYWIPAPNWSSVVNTSLLFLGMRTPCPSPPCSDSQIGLAFLAGHEEIVTVLAIVAVACALAIAVRRHDVSTAVVVLWLATPFAVILLLALRRPLYLDRIFLDATFPLYLLLGAGVTGALQHPRRAVMGMLPIAIVLGSSLAGLQMRSSTSTNPDWRPLTRDLAAAYRPGQAVLFVPAVVRSIVRPYLPSGWHATREELMWYDAYLDVPGWTRRYGRWSDNRLRDLQMRDVTRGGNPVWLVTMDYTGTNDTRAWFAAHGYYLLLSETYAGDTRLELWDRGLPRDLGPPVLPDRSFSFGWTKAGMVVVTGRVARETGRASLTRNFSVRAGTAYTVNVEWRSFPPAYPQIQIRTFDRFGKLVGSMRDKYGYLENSFPRTEWYSLPATGVWVSQPFGFIAPPGAVRARISISNLWGETDWRRIAVYGER